MTSGISLGDDHGATLHGVLLALEAAFLYAVATLATRKLSGVPPAQIAGLQRILGVAVLAPLADFSTAWPGWQSWSSLLILGLVHTDLMYNLMYAAFQRLTAGMVASLSFIYPLVAILVDFAFFQTMLSPMQLLGILFILVAVHVLAGRVGDGAKHAQQVSTKQREGTRPNPANEYQGSLGPGPVIGSRNRLALRAQPSSVSQRTVI